MKPLLDIADLEVRYGPAVALSGVSLSVPPGTTVGLVGESGSGKTTLGKAVLGLVPVAGGAIRLAGREITELRPKERRALSGVVQVVFQNPYLSFNPRRTIGQAVAEALPRGTRRDEARERVAAMLDRVGVDPDAARRYPGQFSGGQLQRIAIARALVPDPRLLICDEAVSALDLSVQAHVLNLLADLRAERGLSYLFITHDLAVVRHVADRVVVLRRGEVVESGRVDDVCERPRHPYTRELLAAAPVPDPVAQARRRAERRAPAPREDPLR
ncbi:ABC transporter ATP-binding protein [Saccharothrix algeriensis]|uniref:ABC transporter ATP-binding protein n=1 Tax=Saccharothrix algeriensis TaxID=173560 RepID=A0A8T8I3F4_9PSEU|nr:ATP-binding cassette domain-containing protein [Saccharothrix algeriensis]MBM7811204.1 peptide/nickel transport system ATP-binding protein [Saccharothrix algeriensis]QTR05118.1 ABC transporter ATP-binding protein [Saccharothrix algeriensis]